MNGGLNNAAFYDDSSDDEMHMLEGENQAFGLGVNRAGGPVRLLAHRRQLPAVPAPAPIQPQPISIGKYIYKSELSPIKRSTPRLQFEDLYIFLCPYLQIGLICQHTDFQNLLPSRNFQGQHSVADIGTYLLIFQVFYEKI